MKNDNNSYEHTTKGLRPNPMSERDPSTADTQKSPQDSSVFGEVIHTYTRKEALADGLQYDVTPTANQCGLRCPVFFTSGVMAECVGAHLFAHGREEKRIRHLLRVTRKAIMRSKAKTNRIRFQVWVCATNGVEFVTLHAVCGPVDLDDPRSSVTVMLPEED